MKEKYLRNTITRKQKVTTVNFERFHLEILKRKNINVSLLVRELLDNFLKAEFPIEHAFYKKESDEETEKEIDN